MERVSDRAKFLVIWRENESWSAKKRRTLLLNENYPRQGTRQHLPTRIESFVESPPTSFHETLDEWMYMRRSNTPVGEPGPNTMQRAHCARSTGRPMKSPLERETTQNNINTFVAILSYQGGRPLLNYNYVIGTVLFCVVPYRTRTALTYRTAIYLPPIPLYLCHTCPLHTCSGCGKREVHTDWPMVIPE